MIKYEKNLLYIRIIFSIVIQSLPGLKVTCSMKKIYMHYFMKKISLISLLLLFLLHLSPAHAQNAPIITSFSKDFISLVNENPYTITVAAYGTDLDYLLFNSVTVQLGPFSGRVSGGNASAVNINFYIDPDDSPEYLGVYPLIVTKDGAIVLTSTPTITVFNTYLEDYTNPGTRKALNHLSKPRKSNTTTVGLNMHWALGGDDSTDGIYRQALDDAQPVWVREHFDLKSLNGANQAGWFNRYDNIMLQYQQRGIHVVGMLAYGDGEDPYAAPSDQQWKTLVQTAVERYRNYVDVWEIWNEPDSSTYLHSANWKTYAPLLKRASRIIRIYDPSAIILNGAIADIRNHRFIEKLYTNGQPYFDEFNVHLYYCGQYRDDGEQLSALQHDWEQLEKIVHKYRPNEHIWITEMGCSTGQRGIDDTLVRRYIPQAVHLLRSYDNVRPIFLYAFRDRPFLDDAYEANFGLLESDGTPKPIWQWYTKLPAT